MVVGKFGDKNQKVIFFRLTFVLRFVTKKIFLNGINNSN